MSGDAELWTCSVNGRISFYKPLLCRSPGNSLEPSVKDGIHQTAYNGAFASRSLLRSPQAAISAAKDREKEREEQRSQRQRQREIHSELISKTSTEQVLQAAAAASVGGEASINVSHVVTAMHRAARFSRGKPLETDPRWMGLTMAATKHAAELSPMSLALAAWSLATVKHRDERVFQSLGSAFLQRAEESTPHDLSGFAWAAAALEFPSDSLLKHISVLTVERAFEFLPQDLSLVVWSYARLFLREQPLFAAVAAATLSRHTEFAGQNLANTMWAYANVLHEDEDLFKGLVDMCLKNMSALGALEISTVVWSCASVAFYNSMLFSDAVQCVLRMADVLESQQLTSIAWAYARVAHRNPQLFQCVATSITGRCLPLEPSEINRLVWAFAYPGKPKEERTGRAGGFRDASFLCYASSQALQQLQRLDALQGSSIAWSFATLSYRDEKLFASLGERFASDGALREFESQNLAYLVWAFARVRVNHTALAEAVGTESAQRGLDTFEQSHLSMLLWSFARLSQRCNALWCAARAFVPDAYTSGLDNAQGVAGLAMIVHALHMAGERETSVELLDKVFATGADVSGDAFGGWLAGCRAFDDPQTELRLWTHMSKTAPNHGMRVVSANMSVLRALEFGFDASAKAALESLDQAGLTNVISQLVHDRLSIAPDTAEATALGWQPRTRSEGIRQAKAAGRILAKWDYYKEIGVLDYVLARAGPGDPDAVCAAIEAFSREEHLYLKLGAEEKGLALDAMLAGVEKFAGSRRRLIIEVGCYVGYSSVRMGQRLSAGGMVVTMEVDPYHVAVSRSVLELAGLSGKVEIWLGHSEHQIHLLLPRFGQGCVNGTFFDQRGTRYHEDLDLLEENGLLSIEALVSADNVVRPGAPEFMWRVCDPAGKYETQVIAHRDYGQDSVEDWISISRFCGKPVASDSSARSCPASLLQLAYDSDTIRNRSVNERVTEEEWRQFAVRVCDEFAAAGICPPVLRPEGGEGGPCNLHVELLPWQRPSCF